MFIKIVNSIYFKIIVFIVFSPILIKIIYQFGTIIGTILRRLVCM